MGLYMLPFEGFNTPTLLGLNFFIFIDVVGVIEVFC